MKATWSAVLLIAFGSSVLADDKPATAPSTQPAVEITIDATQSPELKDWAENTLKPVLVEWYPKIVAQLQVDGYTAPDHFSIRFDPKYTGVAETSGTRVRANPKWISDNLKGESVGALLHEEVHVVQQPFHKMRGKHMPTWLLEGTCDYIRWFQFEPEKQHPHPHGDQAVYNKSYRVSASFLKWVMEKYDSKLIEKMNAANYNGTYSDDLWKEYTGKTAKELGDEWKESVK